MLLWFSILSSVAAPTPVDVSIRDSIEASLGRVIGADAPAIGNQVARLLRWKGDVIKNVHPGDKLKLLFERAPEPELVALVYSGSEIDLRAYRFDDADGISRYYDESGTLIEPWLLHSPVDGYVQITETVQTGRGKRRHHGLDLKAPEGTPVLTPFDGVVARVNWGSGRANGKCLEVTYENGTVGRFLHLSTVEPVAVPGAKLEAGTRIGAVGSTGHSLAPHLHYEIRAPAGDALDPLEEHGTERAVVAAEKRQAFDVARRAFEVALTGVSATTAVAVPGPADLMGPVQTLQTIQ
ncbi:MAG: M23 family metallopeptidase [Deltaproteobacteria bacterium]|nr:M23 family metallopeptidase [Deltaproteobacteria bacterium]